MSYLTKTVHGLVVLKVYGYVVTVCYYKARLLRHSDSVSNSSEESNRF